jgi:hypothetical protein
MIRSHQGRLVERGLVVAAAMIAVLIGVVSYLGERTYGDRFASNRQIDPLQGNLTDNWSLFGALSATEVRMNSTNDGVVAIEIRAKSPSWSDESTGVSYMVGLYSPGWYEFTGEFQAEAASSKGLGAQLEVHSGRWRFLKKADPGIEGSWQKVDVYFRPSVTYPGAEVLCRFWSTSGDRAGKVLLRNVHIVKIAGAPPEKAIQFNLEKQEEARLGRTRRRYVTGVLVGQRMRLGRFRGAGATVLLLCIFIGICWRLLDKIGAE